MLPILLFTFGISACSIQPQPEDVDDLNPFTQETMAAFHTTLSAPGDFVIETRQQAVSAAQLTMGTTRLDYEGYPNVIRVEKTILGEARGKIRRQGMDGKPDNTIVWLVQFEGKGRIIPPMNVSTPIPFGRVCSFVIQEPDSIGGWAGTMDCLEEFE
jgi:hypothetical protein